MLATDVAMRGSARGTGRMLSSVGPEALVPSSSDICSGDSTTLPVGVNGHGNVPCSIRLGGRHGLTPP